MTNLKSLMILPLIVYLICGNDSPALAFNLNTISQKEQLRQLVLTDTPDTMENLIFLPVVFNGLEPVPEIDIPPCRWLYGNPGDPLWISYQWGDRLQTPGSLWRIAFEMGLLAWNDTSANATFYYYDLSENVINTYDDTSNTRGITYLTCLGNITTRADILGNVYWDIQDGYSTSQRRGIATHEIGHGTSIGHIPNEYQRTSLMYKFSSLGFFENVNTPQAPDVELVNQIYP